MAGRRAPAAGGVASATPGGVVAGLMRMGSADMGYDTPTIWLG